MNKEHLIAILEQHRNQRTESSVIEFKKDMDEPKKIGEYISALANAAVLARQNRAWLIWGIDDKTHDIVGTRFKPSQKKHGNQSLEMWLLQKITPQPTFHFHEFQYPQDQHIVMLEIYPPRGLPLAFEGTRYMRVGSHTTKLLPNTESHLWAILNEKDDWTAHVVDEATIDDLDPEALTFAREKILEFRLKNESDSRRHPIICKAFEAMDTLTILNQAKITRQGRMTRAALLLLGKNESSHFLSPADCKISWILRDHNNNAVNSQHFSLPLLLSTEAVFRKIRNLQVEYMPDGSLFPTPIPQYDGWIMREALHNAIAHQDYTLGGKINVVEYPDKLIISNLGSFIPPSIAWMIANHSPPEHYRNQFLINSMISLRMIDQIGSGIRRMFLTQRERFFPLPDYLIDTGTTFPRVELCLTGKILDTHYTQVLMKYPELSLDDVLLLDRVQKNLPLKQKDAKRLKTDGLIEGRAPKYYISARVSEWTKQRASYIHNRAFDDAYYKDLITKYLQQYNEASRKDIDDLLFAKLSDVLSEEQKRNKIRNFLQDLRQSKTIMNVGTKRLPKWRLLSAFTKKTPP